MKILSKVRLCCRFYAVIVDLGGYYRIIGKNKPDGSPVIITRVVVYCHTTIDGLYIRGNYPLSIAQDYINKNAIPL
jgi:hypothetical protein